MRACRSNVDRTNIRVERIRLAYDATARQAELQAHFHIATLAVALTVAGSAVLAGLASPAAAAPFAAVALAALTLAAVQVRALAAVGQDHERAGMRALGESQSLMTQEED